VVVALVGNEIVKVECRACGGVHRYRPPHNTSRRDAQRKETTVVAGPGTKRTDAVKKARAAGAASALAASSPSAGRTTGVRAAKAAQALEEEWLRAVTPASGSSARPYAMQERFAVNEVLEHPVFGYGVVREVLPPDKMRVLFRDGLRLLRCAC
jgi:hypothetical protein